jgi:hypothetical protein
VFAVETCSVMASSARPRAESTTVRRRERPTPRPRAWSATAIPATWSLAPRRWVATKPITAAFLGGSVEERRDEYKKASPVSYVTPGDAPMLMFNGTKDPLVPHTQAYRMLDAMTKAGVPGRADIIAGAGHGWGGPELTRRAIDLISPIGYGQRALIVAPARAGKTMLLHAITEGIAINHPNATLLILLVDERPEEVSEAISWGVGEVIASSFDQPADRHVEVTEMVLEHARRLVEMGKDVVIVLDSLTRMARAHNTAERGTGRTLSGGLDTSAMAKPKAFFGSARSVAPRDGGGSLTIISTALIETGSRMDDVIFEEFKGTGNSEIKLDRSLAEKRIYPAIDIATSGTRREEKLFRPDQLDHVYTLRRGLAQMPPQAGMEWLIKRIANTPNNDQLLSGL